MMVDQGYPVEDDAMKPDSGYVFSFPIKSPSKSVMRDDKTAIEQLELWKIYQQYWCEHKPSITVYVREHEWMRVGAWVYDNFDILSGVSFLPHSDHTYKQAPYQEITEEQYNELVAKMPEANWKTISEYEKEDTTTSTHEFACVGNACEITTV
jgi:ribonucleoside-diphosphate reductase alpha chain